MDSKSSTRSPRDKTDLDRKILNLFSELGPLDFAEVSRRAFVSKSSVRRYYKRLERGRIRFRPNVNRWALGLRRIVLRVRFYREFEPHARQICVALAQLAYLAYFARLMPENEWVLHFQVPVQHQQKLSDLLRKLEELQVLTTREAYLTDLRMIAPFRGEYFDHEVMRFRFDWGTIKGPASVPDASGLYHERPSFDTTDLRIVEMLQVEPLNVSEIARRTGLDKWTCYWHWKHHINGKIFSNWYVDWLGTWVLDQSDFTAMSRREYSALDIFGKSLSSYEMQRLREKFYALPYLASEVIGKTDIFAQFFVPNQFLGDAFNFFGSMEDTMKSKIVVRMEDQGNAIAFTIPGNLYDDQAGWRFEIEKLVAGFRRLVVELSGTRSGYQ